MSQPQTVVFNLDHVIEILRSGVRRADVFMGIGVNASVVDPPISHVLSPGGMHHINLVKTDLTMEEKTHVADEFGKWIRANGLRELTETFSLFLDQLYQPLFIMQQGVTADGVKLVRPDRLERFGIVDKVEAMGLILPIIADDRKILASLNRMRNCYAHRRGVVGPRDFDEGAETMTVSWNAFEMQVREPDGNIIPEAELYGRLLEQGGIVQLRVVERRREFAPGTELVLEKRDLKEICLTSLSVGQRLLHETVEYARKAGLLAGPVDENLDEPKPV